MGTGFYGSNDPTNSVKALKEQKQCSLDHFVMLIILDTALQHILV